MKKLEKLTPILLLFLAISIRYGVHIFSTDSFYIGADTVDYTTSIDAGHFLTTSITRFFSSIFPSISSMIFPLFFGGFLTVSLAYFLKDTIDLKLVLFLLPFTGLIHWQLLGMGIYAQLFSLGLFLIGLKLFLDNRAKLSIIVFPLSILAHFWTGGVMLLIFVLFLFSRRDFSRMWKISLPGIIFLGLITIMFPGLVPGAIHSGDLSYLLSRMVRVNLGLVFFAVFGVYHFSNIWNAVEKNFLQLWVVVPLVLMVVLFCFLKRFWSLVPLFVVAVGGAGFLKENREGLFYLGLGLVLWSGFVFV